MGIASRRNPMVQAAQGPPRVRDAVGRVLEIGDEVLAITPKMILRVATISPMLDPGAPPGAMMVTLVCRVAMVVPRDQGIEDFYFLRHQAEIGDKAIAGAAGAEDRATDGDPSGDMTNAGDGGEHL